ncbi:MAG: hypothetical protein RR853_09075 [Aurantimicrobium sp.]|uniref:helix-turn-helix transcriptional regulator n=1 Tax=Aurantimicrobium sp. TaxID=1930784 RepID=UPI002FC65856
MKTLEDRDKLIDEAINKAPYYERDELISLVRRMKDCLDEGVLLNREQVMEMMGISTKTLERYRMYDGLPYIKVANGSRGARIFFYEHEVHEWLRTQTRVVFRKHQR